MWQMVREGGSTRTFPQVLPWFYISENVQCVSWTHITLIFLLITQSKKGLRFLSSFDATVKVISSDDFGRILSCELKYENKTYIITNVYCPNDSGVRKTFIRDIIVAIKIDMT
jgi:hypothetical protein